MSISPRAAWGAAAAAMLGAGALALWSTRAGPGLSPDSLKYLLLARSLAEGNGFDLLGAPAAHYPPGYPALLAAIGAGTPDTLGRVRVLHALLFALNTGLAMVLASRADRRAAILVALLFLGSPGLLTVHAMVWSEPAFLATILGAALLLSAHERGRSAPALAGAAACLAGGIMVRYAGLGFVPAAALVVLRSRADGGRRHWREPAWLAAGALLPGGAWLLHNLLRTGSATNRALAFHPPDSSYLAAFLRAEGELWGLGPHVVAGLAATLMTLAASWVLLRPRGPVAGAGTRFAAGAWASYPAFLLVSVSLIDADTPLDVRMLAPLHVCSIVLVATAAVRFRRTRASVAAAMVVVVVGLHGLGGSAREAARLAEGEGFASPFWRESETLAGLRADPPAARVFTNGPEVVAWFVGGDVADLPAWASRVSLEGRPEFGSEMKTLCAAIRDGGKVVSLDGVTWAWEVPTAEQLLAECDLRVERRFADGVVLGSARPSPIRVPAPDVRY